MQNDSGLPDAPQAQPRENLGSIVTKANILMAIVLIAGIYYDNRSATMAVLSGLGYFAFSTGVTVLALSHTLTEVLTSRQQQITVRQLNRLQYAAQMQLTQNYADPVQTIHVEPVQPMQLPDSPSFVPPVPRTPDVIRVDAANFVTQLFDASTGRPMPNKITPKKAQIQHKSPSPEAIEYLLALEIVTRGEGQQLYYNRDVYTGYPTLREAINAIRTGVRRASWQEGKEEEGRVLTAGEVA